MGVPFSFFVQWHLTERCNLKCRHCYQQEAVPELTYPEICQALDNVEEALAGWAREYDMAISPSLHFTGGEPFLREDLFSVLDRAGRSGAALALMSNGTLITRDVARQVRQTQVREAQVSLDGLQTVHDRIRGLGSFQRAIRGIANLVDQGVETHINITVSRLNLSQIEGLARMGKALGASAVSLSRLVPCGRGEGLSQEVLSPQALSQLHASLAGLADQGLPVLSRDPLATVAGLDPTGDIPDAEFPVSGCAAGLSGITIAADGSIMPCRRMNLSIGNIKQTALREVWATSPVLWSLRTRSSYHGGCDSCRFWAMCRGCRAVALASARARGDEDYLGPDPQCPYYQASG